MSESISDEREAGRGVSAGGLEDLLEVDGVLVHGFSPMFHVEQLVYELYSRRSPIGGLGIGS